jgi:hypothetical protein
LLLSVAFAAPALQLRLDPTLLQDPPSSTTPKPAGPAPTAPEEVDLLPPEKAPDAATLAQQREINDKIRRRRTMLELHQLGGFATLASLTVAVTLGQLDYLDKYAGGGDSGRWITPHAVAGVPAAARSSPGRRSWPFSRPTLPRSLSASTPRRCTRRR